MWKYYVLFNMVEGIGPKRIEKLKVHFGSLERAWEAPPEEIRAVAGLPDTVIEGLIRARSRLRVDDELERARRAGARIITVEHEAYPQNLRDIYDPPPVLYVKGDLAAADRAACAIVGTRRASSYGCAVASQFAYELAANGVTIVSGLALGVDSAAHRGALKAGGRTIAVLGSGVDCTYPPENSRLCREIIESGAVLSEFPMGTAPLKGNFVARNRVISGLSVACIVVEAPERSGALITSYFAMEQGRPVFAVPGDIRRAQSRGTHALIKDGATLANDVDEILETIYAQLGMPLMHMPGPLRHDMVGRDPATAGHGPIESLILEVLDDFEPVSRDEIYERAGPHAKSGNGEIELALLNLQMSGAIRPLPGGSFVRVGS
ncbi:MAG TPA: DNA-protecting protein DprA [Firmicutes bacterium]|nr:DNA-protecting protein DprA [Bacillota bacterium]